MILANSTILLDFFCQYDTIVPRSFDGRLYGRPKDVRSCQGVTLKCYVLYVRSKHDLTVTPMKMKEFKVKTFISPGGGGGY